MRLPSEWRMVAGDDEQIVMGPYCVRVSVTCDGVADERMKRQVAWLLANALNREDVNDVDGGEST